MTVMQHCYTEELNNINGNKANTEVKGNCNCLVFIMIAKNLVGEKK